MAESWVHDLIHEIMQRANQQAGDAEFHEIGHVIEYDPLTNMCRCLLPSKRTDDEDGNTQIMETGWCQVGSPMVGNGWGIQYHLKGGATQANPELGEQVQISIQNVDSGLRAIANLTFNDTTAVPPGSGKSDDADGDPDNPTGADDDPNGTKRLKSLEWVMKHASGSFFKFYENGNVQQYTAGVHRLYAKGNIEAVVREGDLNVTVEQGSANIEVTEGDANVSVELGDVTVEAEIGDAAVSAGGDVLLSAGGDVGIEAAGAVEVDAVGAVEIRAATIQLFSTLIQAGASLVQQLCNLDFLAKYNGHSHASFGALPDLQAVPGADTTVDFQAG